MKIGEVARRVGIPIDTVRYYERNGLLPPPARRASGYRDYHDGDIARLNFVLRAKALGFTLVEIRELLELSDSAEGDMANIRERAASKLQDIEQRIGQLARVRDALEGLVKACPGRGHVSGCPIRSALLDTGRRFDEHLRSGRRSQWRRRHRVFEQCGQATPDWGGH